LTKKTGNSELQKWLEEQHPDLTKLKKDSAKSKKPRGKCNVCGKAAAKFICLKCEKPVCPTCYFNIIGVCKNCVPEETVRKWKEENPNWEKILGVEWIE